MTNSQKVKHEAVVTRRALVKLLRNGPMVVSPKTIAEARKMSDAEVLSVKYELRDFLRSIAQANTASGRVHSRSR